MLYTTRVDSSIWIDTTELVVLLKGREFHAGAAYGARGVSPHSNGSLSDRVAARFPRGRKIVLRVRNRELTSTLTQAMQHHERLTFTALVDGGVMGSNSLRIENARVTSITLTTTAVENDETHWVGNDRKSIIASGPAWQITLVQE